VKRWLVLAAVVSIVWTIGMSLYAREADQQKTMDWFSVMYTTCVDQTAAANETDLTSCFDKAWLDSRAFDPGWSKALFSAIITVPISWLIVSILLLVLWYIRRNSNKEIIHIQRRSYRLTGKGPS
jgi:hypothetical protein